MNLTRALLICIIGFSALFYNTAIASQIAVAGQTATNDTLRQARTGAGGQEERGGTIERAESRPGTQIGGQEESLAPQDETRAARERSVAVTQARPLVQPMADSSRDLSHLILAAMFMIFSFFLLAQSVEYLAWVTPHETVVSPKDEKAPVVRTAPDAGVGVWLSIFVALSTCALWLWHWTQRNRNWTEQLDGQNIVWTAILIYPRDFVPALLLAALLPSAVAGYKFMLAAALAKTASSQASSPRTISVMVVGVLISVVNLTGSIASILGYFGINTPK